MPLSLRSLAVSAALLVTLAPATFAGGLHARIEGPEGDDTKYTVRVQSCDENTTLEPWGLAEGVVDGKRMSVLLRIRPTSERGVYQFERTWHPRGHWMIRVSLGHPPAPATVATLREDGTVKSNALHWKTDGGPECSKALKKYVDPKFADDDC